MVPIDNVKDTSKKGKRGRPRIEIDKKSFVDLVGLGCSQDEICWYFRDESGKPISEDTLTRFCKREFGCNFAEYRNQNSMMFLKIKLRRNQLKLSEKSASMAIWLGKQMLDQKERPDDMAGTEPVRIVIDV